MARGQYKGNRGAVKELKQRKINSHFAILATHVKDEAHLATILDQCHPVYRERMFRAMQPHLPFKIEYPV